MDLAIASGLAAGEAGAAALDAGTPSAGALLPAYTKALRDRHILTDLEAFSRAPTYLKNARLFDVYPRFLIELAERVYTVDGGGKERLFDAVLRTTNASGISKLRLVLDLLQGARSM